MAKKNSDVSEIISSMREIDLTNYKKGRRAPIKINLKHGKNHQSLELKAGQIKQLPLPNERIDVKGIKLPKEYVKLNGPLNFTSKRKRQQKTDDTVSKNFSDKTAIQVTTA